MTDRTPLVWVDLETTGTDENLDEIIEVGALVTDNNLVDMRAWSGSDQRIGSSKFHTSVTPSIAAYHRLVSNDVVREMHAANGLLQELIDGDSSPLAEVETMLLDWLYGIVPKGQVMLAGSGVGHFDRRFINRWMPAFASRLAYPPMDIGVVRRFLTKVCKVDLTTGPPDDAGPGASKTHRAMDDIELHVAEARAYRDRIRRTLPHSHSVTGPKE